jgi:hypothetical protein
MCLVFLFQTGEVVGSCTAPADAYAIRLASGIVVLIGKNGVKIQEAVVAPVADADGDENPKIALVKAVATELVILRDILEFALTSAFVAAGQFVDFLRSRGLPFGASESAALTTVQQFLKAIRAVSVPDSTWEGVFGVLVNKLLLPRSAVYYATRFSAVLGGDSFSFDYVVQQLTSITAMEEHLGGTLGLPERRVKLLLKDVRKSLFTALLDPTSTTRVPVLIPACAAHGMLLWAVFFV